jgi:2-polyprenyl-3-methyl-5-hydroxy-6-metoxy-1,4-benzoquinol methylase
MQVLSASKMVSMMYDEGYKVCPCFWGIGPAKLVRAVTSYFPTLEKVRVLDIGCGEGKNAYYLASLGAQVRGLDVSQLAIKHARALWPPLPNLSWEVSDILQFGLSNLSYDVILATGPLHCLKDRTEIETVINRMKVATKQNGFNVISVFNNRFQDLSGHSSSFTPCLLSHEFYVGHYQGWDIIHQSDSDLEDIHPHNNIPHRHSITRIMARQN